MRRATGLSSLASSFRAASSNSIRQAKAALYIVNGVRLRAASAHVDQALLGQVQVFQVAQVLLDGFKGSPQKTENKAR